MRWRHSGNPEIDRSGAAANSSVSVFGLPAFCAVSTVAATRNVS